MKHMMKWLQMAGSMILGSEDPMTNVWKAVPLCLIGVGVASALVLVVQSSGIVLPANVTVAQGQSVNVGSAFITASASGLGPATGQVQLISSGTSSEVDSGLLSLIKPDTKIVSGIRVDAGKVSPFGQYLLSQMDSDDSNFQKVIESTGFDPKRDLSEIVIAQPAMLILGRAMLTPAQTARIMVKAQEAGATVIVVEDRIQVLTYRRADSATGALAFLPDSTAVMGPLSAVTDAISRYFNDTKTVLSPALAAKIGDLSSTNDAWFLSTKPVADFFGGNLAAPNLSGAILNNLQTAGTKFVQMGLLPAVQQASGGLKFNGTSVGISGEMVARSQIEAEALAVVVNFLTSLIQLNPDNDPQSRTIAPVIHMAQVTPQDSTMQLALSVPESIMEQLFTKPSQIVVTRTLSRDLQNNVVVSLTLTNIGGLTAQATLITVAKIGSKLASVVPAVPVTIPGGSAAPMTVVFPASVGSPGTNTTLTVGGTYVGYVGGSFNFTSRITLP